MTETSARLHLKPRYRAAIEALLKTHLPGVEVWAYGSRVNGRSHDGSDLDLVLRGPELARIDASRLTGLTEALRDSTIPFLVERAIGPACRSGSTGRSSGAMWCSLSDRTGGGG